MRDPFALNSSILASSLLALSRTQHLPGAGATARWWTHPAVGTHHRAKKVDKKRRKAQRVARRANRGK